MRDKRPNDVQQGGNNPISRDISNIWSIVCRRYGHIKICQDKYWKKLPTGNALLERLL